MKRKQFPLPGNLVRLFFLPMLIHGGILGAGEEPLKFPSYPETYLDSMSVMLEPGSGRTYVFSGTGSTFLYGSTQTIAEEGWMGFHWGENKLWDDFILTVNDLPLERLKATVDVRPYMVSFQWPDGVVLTLKMLGIDRDDIQVLLSGVPEDSEPTFYLVLPDGTELPGHKRHKPMRFLPFGVPAGEGDTLWVGIGSQQKFSVRRLQQRADVKPGQVSRRLQGREIWGAAFKGDHFELTVSYGRTPDSMAERLQDIYNSYGGEAGARKAWLTEEINRAFFRCEDETINKALNWVKVSLAGLFFKDKENVLLWAGLPWFNDCWGRDTFISLPGACLVLGKFDEAKQILEGFADWQEKDPNSPDWGKIPNRVRSGEISYNTADGTGWFIREIYEYGLYSGDYDLWRKMLEPESGAVWLANQGTLKHRIDENGFMKHGETATWMDATGPDGPWSPRGDRAVEIQALWLTQLEVSVLMAEYLGGDFVATGTVEKWRRTARVIRDIIPRFYVREDGSGLYDHLNPDGLKDMKIRPNQLFAVIVPYKPVFTSEIEDKIVRTVRENCAYPWGMASLSPSDPDFHPYHQTHHYPKDAAYHMGIVWTWISGPYKSASHAGWRIARSEIEQVLRWGAVGTLSETLDALPRDDSEQPRVSGTVSQTWSLAEFLRTWYQDYVGIKVRTGSDGRIEWQFSPNVPQDWGSFTAVAHTNSEPVVITYDATKGDRGFTVNSSLPIITEIGKFANGPEDEGPYVEPVLPPGLTSLMPPPYPLLTNDGVKTKSEVSIPIVELTDPEGDDNGGDLFGYPQAPQFAPGILDLTGLTISEDHKRYYLTLRFKRLVDPGWHPEYGFQLTFATIAIQTGSDGAVTRQEVGRNSGWKLKKSRAADRFIHVGGGFVIEDGEGHILAMHTPSDADYALGNVSTGEIALAVPRRYLSGDPSGWKLTVLAGAQDDHGGAGIGEFRLVSEKGGQWEGSGKDSEKHNVYDWLIHPK